MTENLNSLLEIRGTRGKGFGAQTAGGGGVEARVSRLATAAFWIGSVPVILWIVAAVWATAGYSNDDPKDYLVLAMGWLSLPAQVAAVVTVPVSVIVGGVAIRRIRRSEGALHGVSRAVFGMCAPVVPFVGFTVAATLGRPGMIGLGLAAVYFGWRKWRG